MNWKNVGLDLLERAGWSAGQSFLAVLLAGDVARRTGLPCKYALIVAAGAAIVSVITTAIQDIGTYLTDTRLTFWPDLLLRLVKTFLASMLGTITATKVFDVTTFHWAAALNVAAVATLTALGKGLLARGKAARSTRDALGATTTVFHSPSTVLDDAYQGSLFFRSRA